MAEAKIAWTYQQSPVRLRTVAETGWTFRYARDRGRAYSAHRLCPVLLERLLVRSGRCTHF